MPSRSRFASVTMVALLASVALSSCFPASPPSPSGTGSATSGAPTPTATVDPSTLASLIVIDGASIRLTLADSGEVIAIPYSTEGPAVAERLTTAIGTEAAVTHHPGDGSCTADTTKYAWPGLELLSPGYFSTAGGGLFSVRVTARETSAGLAVETSGGRHVGSTVAEMTSHISDAQVTESGLVYYSVQNPADDEFNRWGAVATSSAGVVQEFSAPFYFYGDC